jgi:hypothetical protein
MGICQQCIHYRRVKPASQLLAQVVGTTDAAISNALLKIQEDENQQKGYEAQLKSKKETDNDVLWSFRPVMSDFCGLRETEGIYLIAEVENSGGRCTNFVPGRHEKRGCSTCVHHIEPQGAATDQALEQTYGSMAVQSLFAGVSTSTPDNLLNKHREGIASRKAFEFAGAYAAKGVLATKPQYLDYCGKFSGDEEYVVCLLQNPHHTCGAWEPDSEVEPLASVDPVKLPATETSVPPANLEVTKPGTRSADALTNGPSPLTEGIVEEFRLFVEWLLDVDLTKGQEDHLREMMIEQWAQSDKVSVELVEKSIAIFRELKEANEDTRNSWRKQFQPAFVVLLRKETDNPLASFLLDAYEKANPGLATNDQQQISTGARILGGLLGVIGPAVLSSLLKGGAERLTAKGGLLGVIGPAVLSSLLESRAEQPSAKGGLLGVIGPAVLSSLLESRAEQPTAKAEPPVTPDKSKIKILVEEMLEAQRKEEEELLATDPQLALQKKLQNQQINATMLSNMAKMSHESTMAIARNMGKSGA